MKGHEAIHIVFHGRLSFKRNPVPLFSDGLLLFASKSFPLQDRVVLLFASWIYVSLQVV